MQTPCMGRQGRPSTSGAGAGVGAVRFTWTKRLIASLVAAVAFVVSSAIAVVVGFTTLTGAFMTHDGRGMPIEPRWAGPVAIVGGVVIVGVLVGHGLGRATGLRAADGFLAGMLGSVGLWALWCLSLVWRGYEVEGAQVLRGWPLVLIVVPIMALCAAWGARAR